MRENLILIGYDPNIAAIGFCKSGGIFRRDGPTLVRAEILIQKLTTEGNSLSSGGRGPSIAIALSLTDPAWGKRVGVS